MAASASAIATAAAFFLLGAEVATAPSAALGITLLFAIGWLASAIQSRIVWILFVALACRFGIAWFQDIATVFPYTWDEQRYHDLAVGVADYWSGIAPSLPIQAGSPDIAYSAVSAFFYTIFGAHTLTMRVVNSFFGALVVVYVYRIGKHVFEHEVIATRAALAVCLVPSYVLFTSLHMRDSSIWLLTMVLVRHLLRWLSNHRFAELFPVFLSAALICALRPANLPLLAAVVLPFLGFGYLSRYRNSFLGLPFAACVVPLFLVAVLYYSIRHEFAGFQLLSLDYLSAEMQWRSSVGSSTYLPGTGYSDWGQVLTSLPARLIHFTFGPFLWGVENASQLLSALESCLFIAMSIAAVKRLWSSRRWIENPELILFLCWFAFMGLAANAIADSNYGTAIRHRMPYSWVLVLLFAGSHIYRSRQVPAQIRSGERG